MQWNGIRGIESDISDDIEREEEFAMFLDKLISKEQVRNRRCVTENKNVENKK